MTGKQKRQTKAQILQATKVAVRLNPEAYLKTSWNGFGFCRRRRNAGMRCTLHRGHAGPHAAVYKFYNQTECEIYDVWWSADQKLDYEQHVRERMEAEGRNDDLLIDSNRVQRSS